MQLRFCALLFYVIVVIVLAFPLESLAQDCPTCTATTSNTQSGGTLASPRAVSNNNTGWNANFPVITGISRFVNPGYYRWTAGGNNTIQIGGLILESGVTLILDRSNDGISEAFNIIGGCIVVKNNAVLDFRYFTAMESVNICVEPGGKVIFDSRRGGAGVRDDFTFDDVVINLQDPTATLEFGDADIQLLGEEGLLINGWSGGNICEDDVPPPGGVSGNISWDSGTINICEVLNLRVLPVEWLYFNAGFQATERQVRIEWGTAKEWESSHFEVLRSIGNIREWESLGDVNAMGWSDGPVDYNFTDTQLPLAGGVVYYQLRQVDLDGKFSMSKIVSVRIPPNQKNSKSWGIYPNPTNGDQLKIDLLKLEGLRNERIQIKLIHPNGVIKNFDGINSDLLSGDILSHLKINSKGVYVLLISTGIEMEYHRLLYK
ncbi:T9SS C-terminal target domain-containing protein [Aquiflexum sp.]|uniref:T9SS C-terminal target domain-containing protein n=1 Tax=Aquiflexum sp. TaxID=1872584 RepID=UPI00359450F0